MNWQDALDLCGQLLNELELGRLPIAQWQVTHEKLPAAWRKLDHEHERELAEAVIFRAEHDEWPPLDPGMAELLRIRVEAAESACETLALVGRLRPAQAAVPSEIAKDPGELIAWLLLEWWEAVGFAAIDGSLERFRERPPPDTAGAN